MAQSVYIDGFTYLLNEETRNAIAQGAPWQDDELLVNGVLTVPSNVKHNDKNYYVVAIDDNAFAYWDALEWVNLPETLQSIGEGAFHACRNLRFLANPSDVLTTIKAGAFSDCVRLEAFRIPPFLAELGSGAFEGCVSLGTIDLSGTLLVEIPYAAFRGCKLLRVVNMFTSLIPGITGIRKIHGNAFEGCGFSWIYLPPSLLSIGSEAFKGCKELELVECGFDDPFRIDTDVFDDYEHTTLKVPKGTQDRFKKVSSWNLFWNMIEADDTETSVSHTSSSASNEFEKYFDISGRKIAKPTNGISILRTEDGRAKKLFVK